MEQIIEDGDVTRMSEHISWIAMQKEEIMTVRKDKKTLEKDCSSSVRTLGIDTKLDQIGGVELVVLLLGEDPGFHPPVVVGDLQNVEWWCERKQCWI